ncbi:YjdF family protein [Pseudoflavonifractor sp. HCP28S3_F10]|uniref:YjdF family protein n=1 Tax=Pseudoflavonifractor sp. HCP28S3_F10 TaxID=3438947 RepID=UPI003F8CE06D
MLDSCSRLSVLFEEPFWIALYERESGGRYEVCKITFGAEPRDYEVYAFFLKNYDRLVLSPAMEGAGSVQRKINPKRLQKQIRKATEEKGVGTKAQQALKLQQEQNKTERKILTRERREAEAQRRFALRQQKRKEKHRGR